MFNSRAFLHTFIQADGLRPRSVKITIRWADWWKGRISSLDEVAPNSEAYYLPESVDELILELETMERKESELDHEIQLLFCQKSNWRWRRLDDVYLEIQNAGVSKWEWTGIASADMLHGSEEESMTEKTRYIVNVLTFKAPIRREESWDGSSFRKTLARKDYETIMRSAGR